MENRKLISVIVPVYNTGQYLEAVIQALLSQDFEPEQCEIIFVDNGSTDQSAHILNAYAGSCPGFKVYSEPERGSYAARNLGISIASTNKSGFRAGKICISTHAFIFMWTDEACRKNSFGAGV